MGPFRVQVNEIYAKTSFKMGMNIAALVYMGKAFLDVWHVFICKRTTINVKIYIT